MSNLRSALDNKKGESTPLLKGSVLPRKQGMITLNVTGCREAPENFNSPVLMDFEPVTIEGVEYGAVPLNKTNTKVLLEHVGDVELEDIQGAAVFQRVLVNNPQTKALTPGLQLIEFTMKRGKAKAAPKAGPASRKGGRGKATDDNVPF
jgi:hypothetical protein